MNDVEQRSPEASTMEAVIVGGDLSRLTPSQCLEWYRQRCEAAGLDPRTQPFQYLTLQGKKTLYATRAATDQLISSRSLNVEIVSKEYDTDAGIYEVVVRVRFPDGRTVEDMAAISVKGLSGDALANARMKCITKAKRRTVLSACGLGMMDETEVETIATAHPVRNSEPLLPAKPKPQLPPPAQAEPKRMVTEAVQGLSVEPLDERATLKALTEVGGIAEKALAYLRDQSRSKPWLKPDQTLDDLTDTQVHTIVSKWQAFFAKINEYAAAQQPAVEAESAEE